MTATPVDHDIPTDGPADNGTRHRGGTRLGHPRVGVPAPSTLGSTEQERRLAEVLSPFVAWMATQVPDETARRRHRDAVERFLRWSRTGPASFEDRRRPYEQHLRGHDAGHLDDARAGLGWWADHRRILALTELTKP